MTWREPKYKHRPCPCGCGELADECMSQNAGLSAAFQITAAPDPRCVCCQRARPKPNTRVERGPIHFDCWEEHHSDPYESHDCYSEEGHDG